MKTIDFLKNLPSRLVVTLITFYQHTLSPDHSWLKAKYPYGFCRQYPSCSEYSKQAIVKNGLVKGAWLAVKRIARCNPWAEPRIDLIHN